MENHQKRVCKSADVRARLTLSERKALETISKAEGVNLSETMRQLVRGEAQRRGLFPTEEELRREGVPC